MKYRKYYDKIIDYNGGIYVDIKLHKNGDFVISDKDYQQITKDIAGARAKNRFSYEMSYGIKLSYDLYLQDDEDFFVIFDYACDIEAGKDKMSFYQLKTTEKGYSLTQLLSHKKEPNRSILQTLIDLKTNDNVDKLYIVSNMGLKGVDTEEKTLSNVECFCFSELSDDNKKKIEQKVTWPSGKSEIDSIYFVQSELCVKKQTQSLLGYTNEFLDKVFPKQPSYAKGFMDAMVLKVREKANYEFETLTIDDTIKHKGINRKYLAELLRSYQNNIIDSDIPRIKVIKKRCEDLGFNVSEIISVSEEYNRLFMLGCIDCYTKKVLGEMKKKLTSEYGQLQANEAICQLYNNYQADEKLSESAIKMLAIIAYEQLTRGEQ